MIAKWQDFAPHRTRDVFDEACVGNHHARHGHVLRCTHAHGAATVASWLFGYEPCGGANGWGKNHIWANRPMAAAHASTPWELFSTASSIGIILETSWTKVADMASVIAARVPRPSWTTPQVAGPAACHKPTHRGQLQFTARPRRQQKNQREGGREGDGQGGALAAVGRKEDYSMERLRGLHQGDRSGKGPAACIKIMFSSSNLPG